LSDATVAFPILRDRGTFNGRKAKIERWVGQRAAAMIENMQPYQGAGPDKNALLFIHSRDITDKHKLLVPLVGIAEHGQLVIQGGDHPSPSIHTVFSAAAIEDDAVLAKITETEPISHIVVPSLESLISVVENVGSDFAPLFGHSSIR
jgi:hypothetical protein